MIPSTVAGVPRAEPDRVARSLLSARFGAVFVGIGLTQSGGRTENVSNAIGLVDELNRHTRYTLTPMRGHRNVCGTNQTFTCMTGYPFAVDYSRGVAYYNPRETPAVINPHGVHEY